MSLHEYLSNNEILCNQTQKADREAKRRKSPQGQTGNDRLCFVEIETARFLK